MKYIRLIAFSGLVFLLATTCGHINPNISLPTSLCSGLTNHIPFNETQPQLDQEGILGSILSDGLPEEIHDLVPVKLKDGWICVNPDYLMVNGVRVPLGMTAINQITKKYGMELPTKEMVDAIYKSADVKLFAIPMTPSSKMSSIEYFVEHDRMIDLMMKKGVLRAGHKKDVIRSNNTRVLIYGWHKMNGRVIQPLSDVHGKDYYDYSHGIRLVIDMRKKE